MVSQPENQYDPQQIFLNAIKPDWKLWEKLPIANVKVSLLAAAHLAVNVDPERFESIERQFNEARSYEEAHDACTSLGFDDDEFFDNIASDLARIRGEISRVLKLAERCLAINGGNLKTENNGYGTIYCVIDIFEFSSWATIMKIKLPDEFPKKEEQPKEKNIENTSLTDDYSTPLLEITRFAINEIMNSKNDIPRDVLVASIIKEGKERGIGVSDNIARAIFTIIKKEHHDPRKRKG